MDRSVRFLVSLDNNIERIIKHCIDQHPEYPIIIPATFNQLIYEPGNSLLDAVRRNYLLRDLFGYQNPLREETFFFGRQQVVNSVLDLAKSGQNSSIFGLRKSGKTSVIYAIQRKSKGLNCNVAVIDCQNPAVHARDYKELLAYVLAEVRKAIGPKKPVPQLGHTLAEVSENFFSQMNNLLATSKGTTSLIFDEIENISPGTAASPHWRTDSDPVYFWQILRAYVQSDAAGRLSICLVGTSPRLLELPRINDIDNPVYLYAQKRFIPNLAFDETREMVERLGYFMGLEFSPEIISDLQKEFGGHPFFTRQVCSKVHQLAPAVRPVKVSSALLAKAKVEFSGQLQSYLKDIIGNLQKTYPEEFDLLQAVTSGDKKELNEYGREAPDLIDHLLGYGLVERVGEDIDIRFDAIRTVIQHIVDSPSLEGRWSEINGRRNRLESEMRRSLYQWTKSVSGPEWVDVLDKNLTNKRRGSLTTLEPNKLLAANDSQLYLSDLLMIIKDERVLPYLGDQRTVIRGHLDTANKLRKDAHANSISDAELISAREAFDYLEAEFCAP